MVASFHYLNYFLLMNLYIILFILCSPCFLLLLCMRYIIQFQFQILENNPNPVKQTKPATLKMMTCLISNWFSINH